MREQEERLLNRIELAEALGVTYQAIIRMENEGCPTYRVGNKTPRYMLSEVLNWVKNERTKAN